MSRASSRASATDASSARLRRSNSAGEKCRAMIGPCPRAVRGVDPRTSRPGRFVGIEMLGRADHDETLGRVKPLGTCSPCRRGLSLGFAPAYITGMSRAPANDVPPDILTDDLDDDAPVAEAASDVDLDLEASPGSVRAGTEVIRRVWSTLPNSPGVYRMIDAKGEVLYIGKAKSLKSRVGSYARGQAHSNRLARMVADTAAMEFVTTATETEALLLEANLIKQLRPRYNVLLRDDKSLPYILLTADTEAPQIAKHRGARNRPGHYYGPFASVWAVNRTINALQRAFLLRSCNDSYYENRTRPCLLHQIKRCSGPCTREIALDEYQTLVGEAQAFLSGKSNAVKDRLPPRPLREGERRRDAGGGGKPRIRARGALPRPSRGALGHPGRAGRQHPLGRGRRRVRHRRGGGPVLRRGVFLPQLAELGQPRLLSAGAQIDAGRGGFGGVPGPVLRRQARAPAHPAVARRRGLRTFRRGVVDPRRAAGRDSRRQARRAQTGHRLCPAQR